MRRSEESLPEAAAIVAFERASTVASLPDEDDAALAGIPKRRGALIPVLLFGGLMLGGVIVYAMQRPAPAAVGLVPPLASSAAASPTVGLPRIPRAHGGTRRFGIGAAIRFRPPDGAASAAFAASRRQQRVHAHERDRVAPAPRNRARPARGPRAQDDRARAALHGVLPRCARQWVLTVPASSSPSRR